MRCVAAGAPAATWAPRASRRVPGKKQTEIWRMFWSFAARKFKGEKMNLADKPPCAYRGQLHVKTTANTDKGGGCALLFCSTYVVFG